MRMLYRKNECFNYELNPREVHEAILLYLEKTKVVIEDGKEFLSGGEEDGGIALTLSITTEYNEDLTLQKEK